jgi:hypothetical protein
LQNKTQRLGNWAAAFFVGDALKEGYFGLFELVHCNISTTIKHLLQQGNMMKIVTNAVNNDQKKRT